MSENEVPQAELPITEEELEKAAASAQDPVEIASSMFALYLKPFKELVAGLSSKGKERVLVRLIESPLEETPYKWGADIDNREKQAYMIGHKLLEAKNLMMVTVAYEHQMAEEAKAKEATLNNETNEKENNNDKQ